MSVKFLAVDTVGPSVAYGADLARESEIAWFPVSWDQVRGNRLYREAVIRDAAALTLEDRICGAFVRTIINVCRIVRLPFYVIKDLFTHQTTHCSIKFAQVHLINVTHELLDIVAHFWMIFDPIKGLELVAYSSICSHLNKKIAAFFLTVEINDEKEFAERVHSNLFSDPEKVDISSISFGEFCYYLDWLTFRKNQDFTALVESLPKQMLDRPGKAVLLGKDRVNEKKLNENVYKSLSERERCFYFLEEQLNVRAHLLSTALSSNKFSNSQLELILKMAMTEIAVHGEPTQIPSSLMGWQIEVNQCNLSEYNPIEDVMILIGKSIVRAGKILGEVTNPIRHVFESFTKAMDLIVNGKKTLQKSVQGGRVLVKVNRIKNNLQNAIQESWNDWNLIECYKNVTKQLEELTRKVESYCQIAFRIIKGVPNQTLTSETAQCMNFPKEYEIFLVVDKLINKYPCDIFPEKIEENTILTLNTEGRDPQQFIGEQIVAIRAFRKTLQNSLLDIQGKLIDITDEGEKEIYLNQQKYYQKILDQLLVPQTTHLEIQQAGDL